MRPPRDTALLGNARKGLWRRMTHETVQYERPGPVREWTIKDVHEHLQHAFDLEMWTIPYYMAVMYSIKDVSHPAFRLIQSVVHQEMLHAQLAANVYNAFPPEEKLRVSHPYYGGVVPYLNFDLDEDALRKFGEPNSSIGGLDSDRIGTMCLIELPESNPPSLDPQREEYATIGDFYTALRYGMGQFARQVRGGHHQVDYFGKFYRRLSTTTVTKDGPDGLQQALLLIDVIAEQGEGRLTHGAIPRDYQNTADGYDASSSHFSKFNSIRDAMLCHRGPATYASDPTKTDPSQGVLKDNFEKLISAIGYLFNGEPIPGGRTFGELMSPVGASILACWQHGVLPQFDIPNS